MSHAADAPAGRTSSCAAIGTAAATVRPISHSPGVAVPAAKASSAARVAAAAAPVRSAARVSTKVAAAATSAAVPTSSAGIVTAAAPLSTIPAAAKTRRLRRAGVSKEAARNSRAAITTPAAAAYHAPST